MKYFVICIIRVCLYSTQNNILIERQLLIHVEDHVLTRRSTQCSPLLLFSSKLIKISQNDSMRANLNSKKCLAFCDFSKELCNEIVCVQLLSAKPTCIKCSNYRRQLATSNTTEQWLEVLPMCWSTVIQWNNPVYCPDICFSRATTITAFVYSSLISFIF